MYAAGRWCQQQVGRCDAQRGVGWQCYLPSSTLMAERRVACSSEHDKGRHALSLHARTSALVFGLGQPTSTAMEHYTVNVDPAGPLGRRRFCLYCVASRGGWALAASQQVRGPQLCCTRFLQHSTLQEVIHCLVGTGSPEAGYTLLAIPAAVGQRAATWWFGVDTGQYVPRLPPTFAGVLFCAEYCPWLPGVLAWLLTCMGVGLSRGRAHMVDGMSPVLVRFRCS
jgi:hypothetical protein